MKKKLSAILLAFCFALSLLPTGALATADAPLYGDTKGHWGEEAIERWSEYGILRGNRGDFAPNGDLTRAQAAVIFMRLLRLTEAGDISGFSDVDPRAWYAEAIARCVAAGLLLGNGDGTMDPNGKITREQTFVLFARAMGIEPQEDCDTAFEDGAAISGWAVGFVNALVNLGVVGGVGDGTLAPDSDITRASLVALLDKSITYVTEDGATVEADDAVILIVAADNVTITGSANTVLVVSDQANVTLDDATVSHVTLSGDNNTLTAAGETTVGNVNVAGDNGAVTGGGTVEHVSVTGDNADIDTAGTRVDVDENATGTTAGGAEVAGGASAETPAASTGTSTGGSAGGFTGGSTGGSAGNDDDDEPPHTHAWGEGTVTTPATEEKEGVRTFTCACGATRTEPIPRLAHTHSWTEVPAQEATCTDPGNPLYYTCPCGGKATLADETYTLVTDETALVIAPKGHAYGKDWSSDETHHWHAATCGHDVRADEAAHAFDPATHKCACGAFEGTVDVEIDGIGYTLAEAWTRIENATGEVTVTLLRDVTLTEMVTLDKSLTVDLNGKKLSKVHTETNTSNSIVQVVNRATLTMKGTTEGSQVYGRINVGVATDNNGSIILHGGSYSCPEGDTVLHINGTCTASHVTIRNATIHSPTDNGIQLNGAGTFLIENSSITGATAVYIKSGTLTVKNSALTGTLSPANYAYNGNGANATGDALVIDCCGYPGGAPQVTIESAVFRSTKNDIGVYEYQKDPHASHAAVAVKTATVSDLSAVAYAQDGATITLAEDVGLTEQLTISRPLTIDGGGKCIGASGDSWSTENSGKFLLLISGAANVTLKNMTLNSGGQASGVQAYKAAGVRLENVALINSRGLALTVNASAVTATGTLKVDGTNTNQLDRCINVGWGSNIEGVTACSFDASAATLEGVVMVYADKTDVSHAGTGTIVITMPGGWVKTTDDTSGAFGYTPPAAGEN